MWERYAAGIDVEHWREIHDRLNGTKPMNPYRLSLPEDPVELAARLIAENPPSAPVALSPCGGCPG